MYSIQAVVKIFYLSLQLFLNWSKCLSFPAQHNGWWRSEFIILKGFCQFYSDNLLLAHLPIRHITVMTAWPGVCSRPGPAAPFLIWHQAPHSSTSTTWSTTSTWSNWSISSTWYTWHLVNSCCCFFQFCVLFTVEDGWLWLWWIVIWNMATGFWIKLIYI